MTVNSQTSLTGSARLDVPTTHLPDADIRNPKIEYLLADEAFYMAKPAIQKKLKDIFGPLKRKKK